MTPDTRHPTWATSDRFVPRVFVRPFLRFSQIEAASGIVLLVAAAVALVWANSPWAGAYQTLFEELHLELNFGPVHLDESFGHLINDGLMAIFFFVVGLEIKRELLVGELASIRQAALPILSAVGGLVAPALIYATLNANTEGAAGWGIPTATDIAFVIGVMAVLGDRIPLGLKVFLTALAIVDDLAAVIVIAFFYTAEIAWPGVALAAVCVLLLLTLNRLGVRHPLPYALLGIVLWLAVLHSGVHATVAGVLAAMTIPARTLLDAPQFLGNCLRIMDHLKEHAGNQRDAMTGPELQTAIVALEDTCEKALPPLNRLETALHPWVALVIMPVFALANAGVVISSELIQHVAGPVTLGAGLGLLLGKPLGIGLAAWLSVKTGIAALPSGVTWDHIHGAAWLAGIGFTMSLFVAALAFPDPRLLAMAKIGVLGGSIFAALIGTLILLRRSASIPAD